MAQPGEREVDGLALYDDIHMTAACFHSTVDATLCVTETLKQNEMQRGSKDYMYF